MATVTNFNITVSSLDVTSRPELCCLSYNILVHDARQTSTCKRERIARRKARNTMTMFMLQFRVSKVNAHDQKNTNDTRLDGIKKGYFGILGAIDSAVASRQDSISSIGRSFHLLQV